MNLLETPRLIIKPTSLENLDNVCELFTDPEVMRYIGQGVRGREETLENLKKLCAIYRVSMDYMIGNTF